MKRRTGHASSRLKWVILIPLVLGCALVILYGRSPGNAGTASEATIARDERANNPWNKKMIDSGVAMLRTGDLVLRTGGDVTSYMLSQLNLHDKTYSHCGIVMIEHGYPFVYHSIGGEDNPDECLRRDSARFWFSPLHNLGYGVVRYDMRPDKIARLSEVVRAYYKEKKKFDMDFDLGTDDKLYCAEFAYKAVNQALADSNYVKAVSLFGFRYVAVDNLFVNPHARLICQIQFK